jgi:hypothetical protein
MIPRAANNSSTMRRPSGKRKYSHTQQRCAFRRIRRDDRKLQHRAENGERAGRGATPFFDDCSPASTHARARYGWYRFPAEIIGHVDVSLESASLCVVDATGRIVREAKAASEPEVLIEWFRGLGLAVTRIGLEAGPLSQ